MKVLNVMNREVNVSREDIDGLINNKAGFEALAAVKKKICS
jgi:hypothetical protein